MRGGSEASPRGAIRFPLPVAIAIRYFRSRRKDAFIRSLSFVAIAGLALGIAAMILALSALTGLQQALSNEILSRTPSLQVSLPAGADAAATASQIARLDGVVAVSAALEGRGWLVAGERAHPIQLVGFEGAVPPSFPGAAGKPAGLYLSDAQAARLGIAAGDTVAIASPRPTLTPFGPTPRIVQLPVAGLYAVGRTEQQPRVALPLEAARKLLGSERGLELWVAASGLDRALALESEISAVLPAGARVRTWRELNRPLFFALRLEKSLMFVGVGLIVVVAALALFADLALIASAKRRELAILGALGAGHGDLRRIFFALGACFGATGAIWGGTIGVLGAVLLDRYRVFSLPSDVYFFDYVPFRVRPLDASLIVALAIVLSLAAAAVAARGATRDEPVEGLRA